VYQPEQPLPSQQLLLSLQLPAKPLPQSLSFLLPQPPQPNPPSIQVIYPWEDNKVNVVGDNIILTVKGYVYSRSNGYVNKVEAYIDNEKVAETIPNYDYFELDITKFGNRQGNKELIIKATTTDNAIGEYKLNIIYDNNLLYSLAVEFIRKI
jgi:hypothetical protein